MINDEGEKMLEPRPGVMVEQICWDRNARMSCFISPFVLQGPEAHLARHLQQTYVRNQGCVGSSKSEECEDQQTQRQQAEHGEAGRE